MVFFFSYRYPIIHKKIFKKIRSPPATLTNPCCPGTLQATPSSQPKRGALFAFALGGWVPHLQTSLLGLSHSHTSGWPQASFLYFWGPLCFSGGSVLPASSHPSLRGLGGLRFVSSATPFPVGCFKRILWRTET